MPGSSNKAWAAYVRFRRNVIEYREQLIELLRKWDDGDGCTSAKEFRQAWRVLEMDAGFYDKAPKDMVDELYEEMDVDETGNIPMDEVEIALKHLPMPEETALHVVVEEPPDDDAAVARDEPSVSPPVTKRGRQALPHIETASPRPVGPQGSPARQLGMDDSAPTSPRRRASHTAASPGGGGAAAAHYQPPRRENLPRLGGVGSPGSPRRRAPPSHAGSAMSATSGCSNSTSAGLTQHERHERRAQRERELTQQFSRYNMPGFVRRGRPPSQSVPRHAPSVGSPARPPVPTQNYPAPGHYDTAGSTFTVLKPSPGHELRPSPWSTDETAQHEMVDSTGRPIGDNTGKAKTIVGDPGRYTSHIHEMFQPMGGKNIAGVYLNSPIPQRPVAVNVGRGQPATLSWQMWNGQD